MNAQNIQTHTFSNGLTLVLEPMRGVQSAAFSILVPSGSIYDRPGKSGTGSILSDLITRGAGTRDTKQLSTDLDNLGVQRSESIGINHLTLSGATLSANLGSTLEIYADMLLRPCLPADQFDAARAGVEQSLLAIEDEPRQKVIIELRRRCYAAPWGLPAEGELSDLPGITVADTVDLYQRCFRPNGTIIGIAGDIDADRLVGQIESLLGDWQKSEEAVFETQPPAPRIDHIDHDSTQTQIGIAYDAVPYSSPDYYDAWAAVGILSGGMSSRLFTEVRERRGLCYSVYATLNSLPSEGRVLCYAGTTVERAQETLDVTVAELVRLGDGIEQNELDRCKARAKSSLVMQQESTFARSASIARDWFHLKRVTTLDEVSEKIGALTIESILDYVHRHPAKDLTLLTIGPQALEVPGAIS